MQPAVKARTFAVDCFHNYFSKKKIEKWTANYLDHRIMIMMTTMMVITIIIIIIIIIKFTRGGVEV